MLPYHLVNAFTLSSPHSGNQAAVVQLPTADVIPDSEKALIARDFGFAETAYVVPESLDEDAGVGVWGLRWWTPEVVRALCACAQRVHASQPVAYIPRR
jgi:predicted PhzF superfamily epimerase YddE/YHI9